MIENRKVMAKNIKRYMDDKGVNVAEICNDLGFKRSTFYEWLNGNAYPRIDKIEMMANYFMISKADLVEDAATRFAELNQNKVSAEEFNTPAKIDAYLEKRNALYERYLAATPQIRAAIDQLLGMGN